MKGGALSQDCLTTITVMLLAVSACSRRAAEVTTDAEPASIRSCVRARMSAAGLRVSDEVRVAGMATRPGRILLGRSDAGREMLNQPVGAVDQLVVWYTDDHYTMLGSTYQPLRPGATAPVAAPPLPKSKDLALLEEKLVAECPGYQPYRER